MKKLIGQQGEVRIIKIDAIPAIKKSIPAERVPAGFIISHSEQGHHHVVTGGDVIECLDYDDGVKRFFATITNVEQLKQDAAVPHGHFYLEPGCYEFRISREYDPFADQIRSVRD